MAKCVKCGRSGMGVLHQAIRLNDKNLICFKCYKELGGDPWKDMTKAPSLYSYDEIKDGFDAYYSRNTKERMIKDIIDNPSDYVRIANHGQMRDVDATDEEAEIYHIIRSRLDDMNYNTDCLRLVRKSDSYVSACMESSGDYGMMDIARFKYTDRAKWIKFCPDFEKIELTDVEDVAKHAQDIFNAYEFNKPYL